MGCRPSRPVEPDLSTNPPASHVPLPEAYYTYNKPFKRIGLMWTSEDPITKSQLEQKRATFWETAPNDGGRCEIWQALQVAFSESDIILSRSILEAANIILPTGNPCEGCFDELGHSYHIPVYCVIPPTNLIHEEDDVSSKASSILSTRTEPPMDYLVPAPDSSNNPFTITVRLSTEKDLKLEINADQETVGSLKTRVHHALPYANEKSIIRMVYLGRILKDNLCFLCHQGDIDLEITFSNKGYVHITNESIIQALIYKL